MELVWTSQAASLPIFFFWLPQGRGCRLHPSPTAPSVHALQPFPGCRTRELHGLPWEVRMCPRLGIVLEKLCLSHLCVSFTPRTEHFTSDTCGPRRCGSFPYTVQFSTGQTECPAIELNSDPVCLEVVSGGTTGKGSSHKSAAPLQMPLERRGSPCYPHMSSSATN